MAYLKGMDITLYEQTPVVDEQGNPVKDGFGLPQYTESPVTVSNVLVGQPSSEDVVNELSLYGKRCAYVLGIPKGDNHDWEDKKVSFFGETFRTYGTPTQGIEALIPLGWNKKVMVERYG